jgi:hypothetical protein
MVRVVSGGEKGIFSLVVEFSVAGFTQQDIAVGVALYVEDSLIPPSASP